MAPIVSRTVLESKLILPWAALKPEERHGHSRVCRSSGVYSLHPSHAYLGAGWLKTKPDIDYDGPAVDSKHMEHGCI